MKYPLPHVGSVLLLLVIGVAVSCSAQNAAAASKSTGNYRDSQVFFQLFYDEYSDSVNLTLLPKNELYISPFGARNVENFTWHDPRTTDFSWWIQAESLKFLLPLIQSQDPAHRSVARSWLKEWYRLHRDGASPNRAAWNRTTVAERAMVLVYYLKEEEKRSRGSSELIELLLREIESHQRMLCRKGEYSFNSNHGLLEAMGLLETTRVYPDTTAIKTGLARLESIALRSVSEKGVHMEHSCGYHFYFMKWLIHFVTYMTSQKWIQSYDCAPLENICEKMKRAAFYMQDHDGNIPPIGDTDPCKASDVIACDVPVDTEQFCFDTEAGYAVYKDASRSPLKRYVVFNIQNAEPTMPYHYHNDALAVYFDYDGETILGDQGRYEYGTSGRRIFFTSPAAHSTILPLSRLQIKKEGGALKFVKAPWWNEREGLLSVGARLAFAKCLAARRVSVPHAGWPILVVDTLSGSAPMVLLWNIGPDVTHIIAEKEEGGSGHQWKLRTRKNHEFLLSVEVNEPFAQRKHSVELLKGSSKPFMGWFAPAYRKCVPSSVVKITLHPTGKIFVTTRIQQIE